MTINTLIKPNCEHSFHSDESVWITFLPSFFLLVDLVLGGLRVAGTGAAPWGSLLLLPLGSLAAGVVLLAYLCLTPWLSLGGAVGLVAAVWDLVGLCVVVVVGCSVVVVVVVLVVLVVVGLVVVVTLVVVVVTVVVARVDDACRVVLVVVVVVFVVFLAGCCTTAIPTQPQT